MRKPNARLTDQEKHANCDFSVKPFWLQEQFEHQLEGVLQAS